MIPFEEKFTAWVDGKLEGDELEAFERELSARDETAADREDILRMGEFLRKHPTAPPLSNPDFFNHQIQQRIAAEIPRAPKPAEKPALFWSFRRLVLAGGFSLAVAFGLYKTLIPTTSDVGDKSAAVSQIVSAWTSEPSISATTVHNATQNMTVVWLDGLEPVPATYAQK